jgi:hypothetical protein
MKKLLFRLLLIYLLPVHFSTAQNLQQTVRGEVKDTDGKFMITGATVTLTGSNSQTVVFTDTEGRFRFEQVPIGRISLKISFIGYEEKLLNNIEVTSGKEVVLETELRESLVQIKEITVKARKNKGEISNEMSLISARGVTVDETQRYAGSFNDPARMVSSFAGVTANPEGTNDIVVRGNSPKYIQWRLEGLEIPNPNHFGDLGSSGGPISALNSNMLGYSEFYTGAFAPEYGDVLSGVFDVKFRNGNNEKREHTFGIGALGLEATVEGPFKKGYSGSYLFNYRYSSLALLNDLNLVNFGGVPKYQDVAFKINLPSQKFGSFTLFGIGGLSSITENYSNPDIFLMENEDKFDYRSNGDFILNNHLFTLGASHILPLNKKTFIESKIGFSGNGIREDNEQSLSGSILNSDGVYLRDSTTSQYLNYRSRLYDKTLRGSFRISTKLNTKHKLEAGTKYSLIFNDYETVNAKENSTALFSAISMNKEVESYRSFLAWQFRINKRITLVNGIHSFYVPLTGEHTIEPRIGARYTLKNGATINAGYGRHSRMEHISTYFTRVEDTNGEIIEPNKKLKLLKAGHYVIGYEKRLTPNLTGRIETYYQNLGDLPVNVSGDYYSTINETSGFYDIALNNQGKGKNYGVELSLERYFVNNFYYLFTGSVYQSKYRTADGKERNSAYNGNYAFNFLAGKEFVNLGRNKNKTVGLNAKFFYVGARKFIPLMRDEQGNVILNPSSGNYYDTSKAYEYGLDDVFQINFSASLKINKQKLTHEFALDIINANNTKAKIYEYFDKTQPGGVGYARPLSILPNVVYRVRF